MQEAQVNKQLADKERVAAALENGRCVMQPSRWRGLPSLLLLRVSLGEWRVKAWGSGRAFAAWETDRVSDNNEDSDKQRDGQTERQKNQ